MFGRVLIANRGEIAVRIARTCRALGIETVAVYSEADAHALHVSAADGATAIGSAPAADSYLSIGRIIDAARASDAEAIHPGYGFLSENPEFASACSDAGLTFIGPPADTIAKFGAKINARRVAREAGVAVVPGEEPTDQSNAGIAACARDTGFPLLLKPSAGGGGKGMVAVHAEEALVDAIEQARREAVASVGNGTLYVERQLTHPRHVEVQIAADQHGVVLDFGERECSIQRRHQKVIEESPSTALSAELRHGLATAATDLARDADYQNVGTVEFLVEDDGTGQNPSFYFLEMNTRLQVEHPVTELVTGIDLVEAQIAIAAGQPLAWKEGEITPRGHAIECRVYAEDPAHDFLPQAGTIGGYREPAGPGIRVDSGIGDGSDVPVHYDPLLAKVIVVGETREQARHRAVGALGEYTVLGVRTNIGFLRRVLEHPAFITGDLHTRFLDEHRQALADAASDDERVAVPVPRRPPDGALDVWDTLDGWRLGAHGAPRGHGAGRGAPASARDGTWGGKPHLRDAEDALSAPMPATVTAVLVAPGATVSTGDTLVRLEAMKMELAIRAPVDGTVTGVACREGELVQPGRPLVTLGGLRA